MSDYYFSLAVGNQRSLCISPLTADELAATDARGGNGLGYYLYEREGDEGLTVLAKIVSVDAAVKLYESLAELAGMSRLEAA